MLNATLNGTSLCEPLCDNNKGVCKAMRRARLRGSKSELKILFEIEHAVHVCAIVVLERHNAATSSTESSVRIQPVRRCLGCESGLSQIASKGKRLTDSRMRSVLASTV